MKLSIIVPVYNTDFKKFKECIDSIERIEGQNYELIIIDDGSLKENSNKYVGYLNNFSNTVYRKVKNGGVSQARNIGISISNGEYISFVDSDDIIKYSTISNIIFENYDIICGDLIHFSGDKMNLKKELSFNKAGCYQSQEVYKDMILHDRFLMPSAKFIKKTFLIKNKIIFNTSFVQGEDALFNMQMLSKNPKIYYLNFPVYYYRFATSNYSARWQKNGKTLLDNFYQKWELEKKISEDFEMLDDLKYDLQNKSIRHIFRMKIVDFEVNNYQTIDFETYLDLFEFDYRKISCKSKILIKIIRNNKNAFIKLLVKIRKIYFKLKY